MRFSLIRNIRNAVVGAAITAASATALSSCDNFNESLPECPQGLELRFVYNYNMEFANAFPSQVHCLTLFVYDGEGNYLMTRTETRPENLTDENWRMTLDLPAGDYRLLAYGGMDCEASSFSFNQTPASGSKMQSLEVALKPSMLTSPLGKDLHPLFYGSLDITVPPYKPDMTYTQGTVKMMKDTNNLRILLSNVDGTPVHDSDYIFRITADNTLFDWRNYLMAAPTSTFCPWAHGDISGDESRQDEPQTLAYAEFSLSRLMTDRQVTLTVKRASDGHLVMQVPLIKLLGMLKSQHFDWMEPQEFLDRESRWNMIFFLDSDGGWLKVTVKINDWNVKINDIIM